MNRFFKISLLNLFNSFIVMSLILAPINYRGESNSAYAEDEASVPTKEECIAEEKKNRENGKPGIYKAGCQFNEDLGKSKLKDHYGDGGMATVEQFIGSIFAMIGITAIATPTPASIAACKGHLGATVTFPIVAAGSLAYLIGEMSANAKFKEASKKAVDHAFMAKKSEEVNRDGTKDQRDESRKTALKNQEENTKQLKAYEALEGVYKAQKGGMDKKIKFATAAEIAFIAAEVVELSDILGNNAAGNAEMLARVQKEAVDFEFLLEAAGVVAGASCGACSTLVASTTAYVTGVKSVDIANTATAQAQQVKKATSAAVDTAKASSMFSQFTGFLSSMAGKVAGLVKSKTELAESNATATANDTVGKTTKANRLVAEEALVAEATACVAAAAAGSFGTCSGAAATLPGYVSTIVSHSATRSMPLYCTSAGTFLGADLDSITPPIVDRSIVPDQLGGGAMLSLNNNFIHEKRKYVKVIFSNFLNRVAMNKYEDNTNNPSKSINQIAETSKYIDFVVEEGMKRFDETDFEKEIQKYNMNLGEDFNPNKLAQIFTNEFSLMNSAQAAGIDFKDFLGMAVKIGVMYYMMSGYVKNYAFPKSGNRAITWGIMAVVNAAILNFDKKKKDEASDRLKIVQKEKEAFMKSQVNSGFSIEANVSGGLGSGSISTEDATSGGYQGKGIMGCAVAKGTSFAPAPCPTVIPKSRFKINTGSAKFVANGSPLKNALNSLPQVAYGAATGMQYSNPSMLSGSIDSLNSNKESLLRTAASLRKKFDKLPKIKDKKGKTIKRASLAGINSKFKKMYSGKSGGTGLSPSVAASINSSSLKGLKDLQNKVDGMAGKKGSVSANSKSSVPSFQFPKSKGSSAFDFDLGDDEGGVDMSDEGLPTARAEEDLGEFVVEAGEINENENVNIFKVISNRYLLSYPVLLEEK